MQVFHGISPVWVCATLSHGQTEVMGFGEKPPEGSYFPTASHQGMGATTMTEDCDADLEHPAEVVSTDSPPSRPLLFC